MIAADGRVGHRHQTVLVVKRTTSTTRALKYRRISAIAGTVVQQANVRQRERCRGAANGATRLALQANVSRNCAIRRTAVRHRQS
jgi:hypothetical protein